MKHYIRIGLLIILVLVMASPGCIKETRTDKQLIETVQVFLDTPPDPSNPDLLTPEERAVVESFTIYKNTCKVQLVEDTEREYWDDAGIKIVRTFAVASREASVLESQYYVELRIWTEVDEKRGNYIVGKITFENNADRIKPEMFNPQPDGLLDN